MNSSPAPDLYIIYGPPASGKTTLARRLRDEQHFYYISVGEITRREIACCTTTGRQLKHYLDRVVEYPTELISSVLRTEISRLPYSCQRVLLDGFPKYPNEAEAFLGMLREMNMTLAAILVLQCRDFEELLRRAKNRLFCFHCGYQSDVADRRLCCPKCGVALASRDDDEPAELWRRYRDHVTTVAKTLKVLKVMGAREVRVNAAKEPNLVYTAACRRLLPSMPE